MVIGRLALVALLAHHGACVMSLHFLEANRPTESPEPLVPLSAPSVYELHELEQKAFDAQLHRQSLELKEALNQPVVAVNAWGDDFVHAVQFTYKGGRLSEMFGKGIKDDSTMPVKTAEVEKEPQNWTVPEGEFITKFYARVGDNHDSCMFETSGGTKSPWFGGSGGTEPKLYQAQAGHHIVGIRSEDAESGPYPRPIGIIEAPMKVEIPPACAKCAQNVRDSQADELLPEAEANAAKAKERLQVATEAATAEIRRKESLASLVKAVQLQARSEHILRLKAQEDAAEAKEKHRSMVLDEAKKFKEVKEAVARQRFVDRIRAAEDARVAELALKAAREAHGQDARERVRHE